MPEVLDTQDYRRVRDLPRRRVDIEVATAWSVELTQHLRLPGSQHPPLRWEQALSLVEAVEYRGAFLGLPVGKGKTLITYLLATVLGSLRSLLVVPGAGLRDKTYHEFGELRRDWREPRTMPRVVTWQELTTEGAAMFIANMRPDLIMIDEADEAANADASWVRRIDRYVLDNPSVVVVLLTGTPGRKSIMNYWHLLCWALRERAPVPMSRSEAKGWAMAIDEAKGRDPVRYRPGVLGATVEQARSWYRTRLAETPGVVLVDGDSCDAPLTVRVRLAREDARLDKEFALFLMGDGAERPALETPCGISVSDPLSRWRITGQYECGLYLRWRYPPPDEWRTAYKAKNAFVRQKIEASTNTRKPLDTEAQVLRHYATHPVVLRWLAVKPLFNPETEAVWMSDSTIQSVRDWLAESRAPGIVWTGCVEFAEALSHATRLSYYGSHGRDQYGRALHLADPTRHMIASWHANKKGFNLQPWTRQLIVMPPPSAKWVEQIFGRSHRAGQTEHVVVDWLAGSGATLDLFETVIAEAGFARETIGLTQKVLRAEIVRATPRITESNKFRWARAKKVTASLDAPIAYAR